MELDYFPELFNALSEEDETELLQVRALSWSKKIGRYGLVWNKGSPPGLQSCWFGLVSFAVLLLVVIALAQPWESLNPDKRNGACTPGIGTRQTIPTLVRFVSCVLIFGFAYSAESCLPLFTQQVKLDTNITNAGAGFISMAFLLPFLLSSWHQRISNVWGFHTSTTLGAVAGIGAKIGMSQSTSLVSMISFSAMSGVSLVSVYAPATTGAMRLMSAEKKHYALMALTMSQHGVGSAFSVMASNRMRFRGWRKVALLQGVVAGTVVLCLGFLTLLVPEDRHDFEPAKAVSGDGKRDGERSWAESSFYTRRYVTCYFIFTILAAVFSTLWMGISTIISASMPDAEWLVTDGPGMLMLCGGLGRMFWSWVARKASPTQVCFFVSLGMAAALWLWASARGPAQVAGMFATIFCGPMHYSLVPLIISRSFPNEEQQLVAFLFTGEGLAALAVPALGVIADLLGWMATLKLCSGVLAFAALLCYIMPWTDRLETPGEHEPLTLDESQSCTDPSSTTPRNAEEEPANNQVIEPFGESKVADY